MGLMLIVIGAFIMVIGFIYIYKNKIPFLGNLPGDFKYEKENFKFYFPLTSSILISLILSLLLFIINRFKF